MFRIKLPYAEELKEKDDKIDIVEYHLYSSIFEATPKLSIDFNVGYETPDALKLYLGSSFPIQYTVETVKKTTETDEEGNEHVVEEIEKEDAKDLVGMFVAQVRMQNAGTGALVSVHCYSDFLAFQRSDIRKAYMGEYGNAIVENIAESNATLSKYEQNVQQTDNVATLYRSLGMNDIEILQDHIGNMYTINGGKPLFFVGLDAKLNFTSVNNIFEKVKKTDLLIMTPRTDDYESLKVSNELMSNYVDPDEVTKVTAADYQLIVGAEDSIFNIKNMVYYTNFLSENLDTTGYILKPSSVKKLNYPVDKIFINTVNANRTVSVNNRPPTNLVYEAKNYFEAFEKLITVKVRLTDANTLKRLYTAGEVVTVVLPYIYSVYNGNYIIAEIEYGQKTSVSFVEMVLIRPFIDEKWVEKLSDAKDSGNFKFPLAPAFDKSQLYSI